MTPTNPGDYPFWFRAVLVTTLLLLAVNVFFFAGPFSAFLSWANRITPGLATLIASLVGIAVIGWQTRRGFKNLIASQEHRAEKERDARVDQARIDKELRDEDIARERTALIAALIGELMSLWHQANRSRGLLVLQTGLLKMMEEGGVREHTTSIITYPYNLPIFEANISKLGLLGASIASDVARVVSRAPGLASSPTALKADMRVWITTYEAIREGTEEWMEDIVHVYMRLGSLQSDTPDPGPLSEMERLRAEKKKEKSKGNRREDTTA
jgi:hypothetical protein